MERLYNILTLSGTCVFLQFYLTKFDQMDAGQVGVSFLGSLYFGPLNWSVYCSYKKYN